jgi:hypothetical protein
MEPPLGGTTQLEKIFAMQKNGNFPIQRGKAVIRCTGRHADLIEQRVKTFTIRWDDVAGTTSNFQSGKYLVIIRYEGRFQNQRTITNDDVLVTGVMPIVLTPSGITLGKTGKVLTADELSRLAIQDGFNNYSEMAFYYLTRRTAYHHVTKDRPHKEFRGYMVTWRWVPHLKNLTFKTRHMSSERKPFLEDAAWIAQQEEFRRSGRDIFAKEVVE